ncbi:binding [Zea mays]|uniref:Binding n=1 Tax=Zea mays TaxID=4577 RepID=A0A1D6MSN3_MAIZE|nr:binding [Zea mays]ONM31929.1 binding [Zea mays]ONM31936.1 binding [Zea mays]ONM31940.1 binding [Zea mays]ONM31941.1 binding [Zea mays]
MAEERWALVGGQGLDGEKQTEAGEKMSAGWKKARVKVYRLADGGKWDDQGTGYVSIDYIEGSKELGLTVLDEDDNDTLLMHNITSDDIYRKQEGNTYAIFRETFSSVTLVLWKLVLVNHQNL